MEHITHSPPKGIGHLVKIRFDLSRKDDGGWPPVEAETMWASASVHAGVFEIRNVPFYVCGVSFGDLVRAWRSSTDDVYEFAGIESHRGHSTYRIFLAEAAASNFDLHWQPLAALGCTYENANGRLYGVDMGKEVNVARVFEALSKGEQDGVWDFEEGYYFRGL